MPARGVPMNVPAHTMLQPDGQCLSPSPGTVGLSITGSTHTSGNWQKWGLNRAVTMQAAAWVLQVTPTCKAWPLGKNYHDEAWLGLMGAAQNQHPQTILLIRSTGTLPLGPDPSAKGDASPTSAPAARQQHQPLACA